MHSLFISQRNPIDVFIAVMYRSAYLQGRNRDTDVENWPVDTLEEGEGEENWEIRIDIYVHYYV